tara:strand:+ start:1618 stop:2319 length:702 start_codon:yes stop_codon:yes gene_type:complete
MALPKLNDSPKYELIIPSTKQKVNYRPYLVKEEKILMMAMETQDSKATLSAVVDTIAACVQDEINTSALAIFDVEYMFTQIRSKSVGENAKLGMKCSKCEHDNEVAVDVSSVVVDVPEINNVVQLTDEISIEMKWPTYKQIIEIEALGSSTSIGFDLIGKCIEAIVSDEERTLVKDVSNKEIVDFIESMTSTQFGMLSAYVEQMPKLTHDIYFECERCEEVNTRTLQGMTDFF